MTFKELRESKLLSRRELAEKVGVSDMAIYRWEKGKYRPSMASLRKLVEVFGQEVVDCFKEG